MPNFGAVRRGRFLTIDNPLNPPAVGWVKFVIFFNVRVFFTYMRAKFGRGPSRKILNNRLPPKPPWGGGGSIFFLR